MTERFNPEDTQPIGVRRRAEQPVEIDCQLPVTTVPMEPYDASAMTIALPTTVALPLIEKALEPQTAVNAQVGRETFRFHETPTLTRPISDFDDWYEIEQIGDAPEPWSPRRVMAYLAIKQFAWTDPPTSTSHARAVGRTFGINPRSHSPVLAVAHEFSHIELGHTDGTRRAELTKEQREVEAELSSFVIMSLIGAITVSTVAVSKWYIHHYLDQLEKPLDAETIDRVGDTAMKLLWAGGWE